jgi:hypothetical protein
VDILQSSLIKKKKFSLIFENPYSKLCETCRGVVKPTKENLGGRSKCTKQTLYEKKRTTLRRFYHHEPSPASSPAPTPALPSTAAGPVPTTHSGCGVTFQPGSCLR